MASQQVNEIDEIVKGIKKTPGFKAYLVLSSDGVVLRWEQEGEPMPYEKAVQYSHYVIDLCSKSKENVKDLFNASNNDEEEDGVESIRVRTDCYELIVAQEGNYILVVIYVGATNTNYDNESHNGLNEGSKETS